MKDGIHIQIPEERVGLTGGETSRGEVLWAGQSKNVRRAVQ